MAGGGAPVALPQRAAPLRGESAGSGVTLECLTKLQRGSATSAGSRAVSCPSIPGCLLGVQNSTGHGDLAAGYENRGPNGHRSHNHLCHSTSANYQIARFQAGNGVPQQSLPKNGSAADNARAPPVARKKGSGSAHPERSDWTGRTTQLWSGGHEKHPVAWAAGCSGVRLPIRESAPATTQQRKGVSRQCTRWPAFAPESGLRTKTSDLPGPAASTMPSLRPNFIFRGFKFAQYTTSRPSSCSDV